MNDYANNPNSSPELVACFREWGIQWLTDVQEKAIAAGVAQGASATVRTPTSSGKTLVGELALANALTQGLDVLYLVSHKALADQKFSDFTDRFSAARWGSATTVESAREGATPHRSAHFGRDVVSIRAPVRGRRRQLQGVRQGRCFNPRPREGATAGNIGNSQTSTYASCSADVAFADTRQHRRQAIAFVSTCQ